MTTLLPRLLGALLALLAASGAALADTTLEPRDRVELRVARWDAAAGAMSPIDWLRGEHVVDDDGTLELPVAGSVQAMGRAPSEVAADAAERIGASLGIVDGVHAALVIVERAPFFVVGAVQSPGAYEYRPGLTALQAVALAGGVRRTATLFTRTDRDAVHSLGDYRLAEVERWRALARIARLEAELAGAENVAMPEELESAEMGEALVSAEQAILEARRENHQSELAAIADLKRLLELRIEKLEQEMALREELLVSTREEREAMTSLKERGLAATSRVNDVAREVADMEARMLALETQVLAAEQQLSEAERDELELIGNRRVSIVTELQDERSELNRIETRLATAEALFAEAARFGANISDLAASEDSGEGPMPTFVITRAGPEARPAFITDASATIRPGDVLEVRAPRIDAPDGALIGAEPNLMAPALPASAPTN